MTDVALKEHLERRIEALGREMIALRDGDMAALKLAREADREALSLAREGLHEALRVARESMERRLEGMNEFREQLRKERGEYVRIDTFKWTVGFLVGLMALIVTAARLWK